MKTRLAFLCLFAFVCSFARADYVPAPQQYTFINAVDGQTSTVYRDGDKVALDTVMPKGPYQPKDMHIHMVVDVTTTRNVQWDLADPSAACSSGAGSWGDPFDNWAQMLPDPNAKAEAVGKEMVNGFATTAYEVSGPHGAKAQMWRDDKYGLLIKSVISAGGQSMTAVNVQEFKVGPPPASVFEIPARCKGQTLQ